MTKKLAIVILNFNGKALLEKFLPQVVLHSPQANIYVIDNASSDDSVAFIKQNFPTIICILNDQNYGYAGGYNVGLKQIQEPLWCLLNSDIEVTENWLVPILDLFNTNDKIAGIQPKILDYKNRDLFEYAGAGGGFIDAYGIPYCRGRIFKTIEKDHGQYDDITEIFWASGACFFIRKNAFLTLNGFDDLFFAHQEEIDLCWRLKNDNFKIYYCGQSTVYHVGGGTLKTINPQKTFLNFRNSLFMLYKNLPSNVLIKRIFIRMCIDGLIAIKFFFEGKFAHAFAIIRAHLAFYNQLKSLNRLKKHSILYYHKKSIVWQYFIKGITSYKD